MVGAIRLSYYEERPLKWPFHISHSVTPAEALLLLLSDGFFEQCAHVHVCMCACEYHTFDFFNDKNQHSIFVYAKRHKIKIKKEKSRSVIVVP